MSNLHAEASDSRSITAISACETLKHDIEKSKTSPTLQRISANAISISLWSKHDVKHEIIGTFLRYCTEYLTILNEEEIHVSELRNDDQWDVDYFVRNDDQWNDIEVEVRKQAENICLPNALKPELYRAISRTGREIREWLICLVRYMWSDGEICPDFVNDIAWTGHGTIDKPRTVDLLLTKHRHTLGADGSLFSLACVLCLNQVIPTLWNLLPEYICRDKSKTSFQRFRQTEAKIFRFWIAYIEGILTFDDAGCEYMLRQFPAGSVDALKYVWCRLSPAGRNRLLKKWITKHRIMTFNLDVLYFYLSRATEKHLLWFVENDAMRLLRKLVFVSCVDVIVDDREVEFGRFLAEIFECEDWVKKVKTQIIVRGLECLDELVEMDRYEMFFNWCFSTDEEIVEFKSVHCSYSALMTKFRSSDIATSKNIDKFCAWCLLSEDETARFKDLYYHTENENVQMMDYLQNLYYY